MQNMLALLKTCIQTFTISPSLLPYWCRNGYQWAWLTGWYYAWDLTDSEEAVPDMGPLRVTWYVNWSRLVFNFSHILLMCWKESSTLPCKKLHCSFNECCLTMVASWIRKQIGRTICFTLSRSWRPETCSHSTGQNRRLFSQNQSDCFCLSPSSGFSFSFCHRWCHRR